MAPALQFWSRPDERKKGTVPPPCSGDRLNNEFAVWRKGEFAGFPIGRGCRGEGTGRRLRDAVLLDCGAACRNGKRGAAGTTTIGIARSQFGETIRRDRRALAQPTRGFRVRDLILPIFEHGVPGVLWLIAGYWVLQRFDDSALGFVGILMMLWGGFVKLGIVVLIYGFVLYAAAFRRQTFVYVNERRHIARVNGRIDRDLEAGQIGRAMDRLHGLLCAYPDNLMLRWRLAMFLQAEGRLVEAGRHLALMPDPGPEEQVAIAAFCKANGHDPFQIMRKAVRGFYGPDLPRGSQARLRDLHRAIDRPQDKASWLYHAVGRYIDWSFRSRPREALKRYSGALIELGVLAGLLVVFTLI
ncbi:DUF6584 family protein [Aestuariibius sp. 2305UL40-4]|uniref:DUF6584 family protein n=1 Tax=Aestuariibius violaceus TaxID=3234132 RepID=UPI00345ED95C